ncbi:peptide/nickel transport system ATP-binding protein [Gemmobacter megaterium]|uniref:Peptide/nickel transport system ATP-binding protein n=1 Tax=Gemmobacter megaterium TaxID=1086013 RepID=A0A1N7NGC4_9RHOB|nr:ABC transporter ATP-binding protein [Gemmobacter megaterium]GGE15069.1 putative peptide ABC transporter ATP-binding protein y4tR [Gemmobacter megaterium]SIS97435.1 peptide/nickel transport system ATP-binding protein [Gemmobacter megaterium]
MTTPPVLSVQDLRVEIAGQPVVDGVTFDIAAGETLAVVGESGCGKSMASLGIIRLLPDVARQTTGQVMLEGARIDTLPERRMNGLRGARIGMIFQEPVASLDPLMPVGKQIAEALALDGAVPTAEVQPRMLEMLERVGIDRPELRARQYPFELSGGMCQRIMIAMTMIRRPVLLIADEPTTALDVTIQKQILDLMAKMRHDTGAAVMLITHDMGVVAESADRVAVMYAGRVVETGPVAQVFARPRHPYTTMLLRTIPRLDGTRKVPLPAIPGAVPDIRSWPKGCRFNTRCPLATEQCRSAVPLLEPSGSPGHASACWNRDRIETELAP